MCASARRVLIALMKLLSNKWTSNWIGFVFSRLPAVFFLDASLLIINTSFFCWKIRDDWPRHNKSRIWWVIYFEHVLISRSFRNIVYWIVGRKRLCRQCFLVVLYELREDNETCCSTFVASSSLLDSLPFETLTFSNCMPYDFVLWSMNKYFYLQCTLKLVYGETYCQEEIMPPPQEI